MMVIIMAREVALEADLVEDAVEADLEADAMDAEDMVAEAMVVMVAVDEALSMRYLIRLRIFHLKDNSKYTLNHMKLVL